MLVDLSSLSAPTNFTITRKLKYLRLKTDPITSETNRFDSMVFVRYATLSDANSDINRVDEIEVDDFDARDHTDLTAGTTYYWRAYWRDEFENLSALTATVSVVWKNVEDADTDATAPTTPNSANLTLSQVQRRDKDGSIKTYLRGVFNTTGYGSKIDYQFQVSDGTNVKDVPSKNGRFEAPAEVGLTYSVTVTALSFNDVQSTASGAVTKLITAKGADIATPAGLAISSAHKRNEVSWTKVNTNTYPDYMETEVYRNTVNTTPTPGTTTPYRTTKSNSIVDAALDTTTLYYYWIAHKDTSGNYTTVSGNVSGTGAKIITGDVAPGAIGSTELGIGVGANQVKNSDFKAALTNWKMYYSSNSSKFTMTLRTDTFAPYPGSLQIYQNDGTTGLIYDICSADETGSEDYYTVVPNSTYEVSVYYLGRRYAGFSVYIEWFTAAGVHISNSLIGQDTTPNVIDPQKNLANYERMWNKATAPATAALALVFYRHEGTLSGQADSYIWMHKAFFAECNPNQSEPTPWSPAAITVIAEGNTSSVAPTTPNSANLVLSKVQRRDKDGGIKSKLKGVFNTTGYSAKTRFQFNISDGTNLEERRSQTGKFVFEAEVGITYSVTVQAYTFVNQPSAASSAVTLLITAKTADIGTPSGLAINSGHKKNRLTWTTVDTDTYPDYAKTVIYRNTVNTTPTPGTTAHYDTVKGDTWTDTLIDTSTLYYYWIVHRDNTGNFTAVAGPVSGTGKRVEKPDVDTVTTPGTPSPGTLTVAQGAKDTDAGDGRISVKITMTAASLPTNADEIQFEVDFNYPSTPEIHTFPASKGLKASFDAIVGKQYSINYRGISVFDVLGPALASPVTLTPTKKSTAPADPTGISVNSFVGAMEVRWTQPTETDYDYTQVAIRLTIGTPANSDIVAISKSITAKFVLWSTANWYVYVRHVDRSGNPSNWVAYGAPTAGGIQAMIAAFIDNAAVPDKLKALSVGDIGADAFLKNNTGSTIAAGATSVGTNLVYSDTAGTTGASPGSGTTWRCLGQCANGAVSLFRRIS